jgi:rfaE bifunctional protein nucleotidyltransferase chain/domain
MINKITVFTNGCFDLLHPWHVEYLQKSKALGDRLIVGINSDASVKRLKGISRPINNQEDRKIMLLALKYVDEVHIFDEDSPAELIKKLKPNILTKGGDYTLEKINSRHLVDKVVIIPFIDGYSTSSIIKRIRNET